LLQNDPKKRTHRRVIYREDGRYRHGATFGSPETREGINGPLAIRLAALLKEVPSVGKGGDYFVSWQGGKIREKEGTYI